LIFFSINVKTVDISCIY